MRGLSLLQTHLVSGPGTPRARGWLRGGAQPQTCLDGQVPGYPCVQFALTAPQEADRQRLCVPQEVSTIAGASQWLSSSLPSPALCQSMQLTGGPEKEARTLLPLLLRAHLCHVTHPWLHFKQLKQALTLLHHYQLPGPGSMHNPIPAPPSSWRGAQGRGCSPFIFRLGNAMRSRYRGSLRGRAGCSEPKKKNFFPLRNSQIPMHVG